MNRRKFLQLAGLTGGGLVASATMAEAGVFAEIASWLKRRPVWSIPKNVAIKNAVVGQYADYNTLSDYQLANAIPAVVESAAGELAYRAAATLKIMAADELLPDFEIQTDALRHLSTIYYDRKAIDALKANINLGNAFAKLAESELRACRASGKVHLPKNYLYIPQDV